jgi:hypothetical protein
MAATGTVLKSKKLESGFTLIVGQIALDSSYPTGGEAIDLSLNERIDVLICENHTGYMFKWDADNQKLLVYRGDNTNAAAAPGVQVTAAVDLSALTVVNFIGVGF